MIKLTRNNIPLLIKENTELTVKEKSPLFDSDITSTAYPISLPAKPNMIGMAFQHRPGAPIQDFPIAMEYNGMYRELLGVITKASKKGYELSMKMDDSIFNIKNAQRNIQDVDLGDLLLIDVFNNPDDYRDAGSGKPFCLPELPNTDFFKDLSVDSTYAYKVQNNLSTLSPAEHRPITPFFYFRSVLKYIVAQVGYEILNNPFYEDDFLKRIFFYSNTSVYKYLDASDPTAKILPEKHLPSISVKDFLKEIPLLFNLFPVFNTTQKTLRFVSFDTLLSTAATIDLSKFAITSFELQGLEYFDQVIYQHEVNSGDEATIFEEDQDLNFEVETYSDLPGINMVGTLAFVRDADKVYLFEDNEGVLSWEFFQDTSVCGGCDISVDTYDNLPFPDWLVGKKALVIEEKYVYRFAENSEGVLAWSKYSIYYPIIKQGSSGEKKEIKSKFSALARKKLYATDNACYAGYQGNSVSRADDVDHPFRLGVLAPDATYTGIALTDYGGKSLVTGPGSESINQRFKRTFDYYIDGYRPAEITLRLPAHMLFNFDFTKKYVVNGVSFIVEELNYKLTNNGIVYSPAKVRLI